MSASSCRRAPPLAAATQGSCRTRIAGGTACGRMRKFGRRHHDGAHRRRVRAEADLGRHCEADEAGLGHRRSRRRRRRQLRVEQARADRGGWRREDHRAAQLTLDGAVSREPAVLAEPDVLHHGLHQRQAVPPRFHRRHPAGRRDHVRRRRQASTHTGGAAKVMDLWPTVWVFVLASFIGLGVIRKVSRLLHTPLMSLTNAISAIAVVGAILVTGGDYPLSIRILGAVALFASVTNIVSGFLITDRMLKMFKTDSTSGGSGH